MFQQVNTLETKHIFYLKTTKHNTEVPHCDIYIHTKLTGIALAW